MDELPDSPSRDDIPMVKWSLTSLRWYLFGVIFILSSIVTAVRTPGSIGLALGRVLLPVGIGLCIGLLTWLRRRRNPSVFRKNFYWTTLILAFLGAVRGMAPQGPVPIGERPVIVGLSKLYVTGAGTWVMQIDYLTALPRNDGTRLRFQAAKILNVFAQKLNASDVDSAVLRAVEVDSGLLFTVSTPIVGYTARKGVDGIWSVDD